MPWKIYEGNKFHPEIIFCLYLVLSLCLHVRVTFGNYTRSLCLLVVCGCATHVVFLCGGQLFCLNPCGCVCRYFEMSPKSLSS